MHTSHGFLDSEWSELDIVKAVDIEPTGSCMKKLNLPENVMCLRQERVSLAFSAASNSCCYC